MKRLLPFLLSGILLILCGCAYVVQEKQQNDVYDLYYEVRDLKNVASGDAIQTKPSLVKKGKKLDTQIQGEALMKELLIGPNEKTLKNPIPKGTKLISLKVNGSHAVVDVSSSYGTLSGISLTMADYCITMTLTQIPGIDSVSVTVRGMELAYRDNQNFTQSDLLLSSAEDMVGTVKATLYFLDDKDRLTPEERTLKLYEGDTQAKVLLKAMEEGPEDKNLTSALPKNLLIQGAWVEDKICYINLTMLSSSDPQQKVSLQVAADAMTWSLRSLDTVKDVQILLNGEPYQRLS